MAVALGATLWAGDLRAADTNAVPTRIGVYDSRAVAFAWFSSSAEQKQIHDMIAKARGAQAAGDTRRFEELGATLQRMQDQMHREGFSTAPATEALAELSGRLPEIERAAGVSALVSKWDEAGLKTHGKAERVDVTERLVSEFKPTEQQLKTIASLESTKPLPMDECNELIAKGKM
jgi:hypothetical protein